MHCDENFLHNFTILVQLYHFGKLHNVYIYKWIFAYCKSSMLVKSLDTKVIQEAKVLFN